MCARILIAGMCLLLVVGCNRRTARNTAPKDESASAKPQPTVPAPSGNANPKGGKDEPNWLNDPRFKKDAPKFDPNAPATPPNGQPNPAQPSASGKESWGLTPPQGGFTPPVPGVQPGPTGPNAMPNGPMNLPFGPPGGPPQPPPPGANPPPAPGLPAPPGMGVLQPTPAPGPPPPNNTPTGAAKKAVTKTDMDDIKIFVHDASIAANKMPTPGDIFVALVKAGSPAAEHVKSGAIILTGATQRESVWAYERDARTNGGLVVSQNGVETLSAAELNQRLK